MKTPEAAEHDGSQMTDHAGTFGDLPPWSPWHPHRSSLHFADRRAGAGRTSLRAWPARRRRATSSPRPPPTDWPARRRWPPGCARPPSTRSSARSTCSAPGRPLRALIEADRLSSVILWGPPGTGKTTLAQLIAHTTAKAYVQLSAVNATVKDVREVAQRRPRPAGPARPGHDPVPRRGPPVQQGPAGRAAAVGRVRAARPDRGHHREPVLRGEPAAALALDPLPARAAVGRRASTTLVERGLAAEGATAEPEAVEPPGRAGRRATGATP